jgi:hypothetical protein
MNSSRSKERASTLNTMTEKSPGILANAFSPQAKPFNQSFGGLDSPTTPRSLRLSAAV